MGEMTLKELKKEKKRRIKKKKKKRAFQRKLGKIKIEARKERIWFTRDRQLPQASFSKT